MSERSRSLSGSEIKVVEGMRCCLQFPLILSALSVYFAAPVASASEQPLKSRTFRLTFQATIRDIPRDAKSLEAWVPLPQTDSNQTIHQISITAPSRSPSDESHVSVTNPFTLVSMGRRDRFRSP